MLEFNQAVRIVAAGTVVARHPGGTRYDVKTPLGTLRNIPAAMIEAGGAGDHAPMESPFGAGPAGAMAQVIYARRLDGAGTSDGDLLAQGFTLREINDYREEAVSRAGKVLAARGIALEPAA